MKKNYIVKILMATLTIALCSCGKNIEEQNQGEQEAIEAVAEVRQTEEKEITDTEGIVEDIPKTENRAETEEISNPKESFCSEENSEITPEQEEPFRFVDAWGEWFETTIKPKIKTHEYDWNCLKRQGDSITYEGDAHYFIKKGIDVSHHQGKIDWEKVKAAGYEFAFVRMVYRGYGEAGSLNLDREYYHNIVNAQKAGLDVGIYVFSQAVSEEEALEEAQLVIDNLKGLELELPVVFDPELIRGEEARTNQVSGEQFTKNTIAFCEAVKAEGYEPMIYSNMYWEAFLFDLEQLAEYPVWYADYENVPQTPYQFTFWQYSESGTVEGIEGNTDLNVWFIPKDNNSKDK